MPKDEFDFDDPLELSGVALCTEEDTTDAMCECFIEEFLRMGYHPQQVLALFRNPHYLGPNMAFEKRGEPFIRDLITEVFARWGKAVTWPREDPLTPALSPSEGERVNRSPSQRETVAAASTSGLEISETRSLRFPRPLGGGEGQGEGASGVQASVSPARTIEADDSRTNPMGAPIPKLNG